MTAQSKTASLDDDFFPDWSTDIPHSTSLSERINLPSSVVDFSNDTNAHHTSPSASTHIFSYLTNSTACLLFFYGTLSLPHVLQRVLGLNEAPILLPASISGYTLKMWGPYPALVRPGQFHPSEHSALHSSPAAVISSVTAKVKNRLKRGSPSSNSLHTPESKDADGAATVASTSSDPIVGMAYWGMEEDIPKLLRFEGENYELAECIVKAGRDETRGRTFVWCGYPEELSEGSFDPTLFPDVDGRTYEHNKLRG